MAVEREALDQPVRDRAVAPAAEPRRGTLRSTSARVRESNNVPRDENNYIVTKTGNADVEREQLNRIIKRLVDRVSVLEQTIERLSQQRTEGS